MTLKDEIGVPCGWYYLGPTSQFAKPTKAQLPGVEVLIYRGESGQFYAVQARCPHMHSDLSKAQVRGESLQCSLHHWTFNTQGKCTGIPGAKANEIPAQACLKTFSLEARDGHLFVHTEANAKHRLPFFANEDKEQFSASRPRQIQGFNHWTVAAANAFDVAHFEFVHFRKPLEHPILTVPDDRSIAMNLSYEIVGKTMADRWLVKKYGSKAKLEYTVIDGNLIIAKTLIGRFTNRMMIFIRPEGDHFVATLFVYTPKSRSMIKALQREMTAFFSYQFFAKECSELAGVELNPQTFGPKDHLLREYVEWLQKRYRFQENFVSETESLSKSWQNKANATPVTISKT